VITWIWRGWTTFALASRAAAWPPKPPQPPGAYARDVLKVDRLIAIIDPHNQPSQRVAENLGMVVARNSDNRGRWSSKQLIYGASL
jgi:hypothetical protein